MAEDDFSQSGTLGYRPPSVQGAATNMDEVPIALEFAAELLGDFMKSDD